MDKAPPGLVYVNDAAPGIRRQRASSGFRYVGPDGRGVRDAAVLDRIRRLAIPPAYEHVWICPIANGHLQATGRDSRGRKQYRYHPQWCLARDADKFERLWDFGQALPRIRRQIEADLAQGSGAVPRRPVVLAAVVRLLDATLVRVGNDEYVRSNGSYGLTTLLNRHAAVARGTLRLRFKGKHGIVHDVALADPRVARVVRHCQAMPGQDLFEYVDDVGAVHALGSADVNDYLRDAARGEFTAKDFRTWHASVQALDLLERTPDRAAASPARILAEVAARLGNTVSVCRKAYVHPAVLARAQQWQDAVPLPAARRRPGLTPAEARFLSFLRMEARRSATSSPCIATTGIAHVGARASNGSVQRRAPRAAA